MLRCVADMVLIPVMRLMLVAGAVEFGDAGVDDLEVIPRGTSAL